mmetsp:Transcript_16943/g.41382  ORF Transcript_16943/g.41382 Transcript_16943/m.41382 type:complete len:225 (-) Transcript_16943:227-901(-)
MSRTRGADRQNDAGREAPSAAQRPMLNKDVKLEELAAYFHLPEKAVAKELGICLTSLKKLCRSYGITRWPFRKLKSLERTMKKVQNEHDAAPNNAQSEGRSEREASEAKRKPYTVGNRTVFLSDEELEVFKMTMGRDASTELRPTPLTTLETPLFDPLTVASSTLASVARSGFGAVSAAIGGGGGGGRGGAGGAAGVRRGWRVHAYGGELVVPVVSASAEGETP